MFTKKTYKPQSVIDQSRPHRQELFRMLELKFGYKPRSRQ